MVTRPGPIALFGSGETAPAGRRVHERLFRELGSPIRVAVLETPAGFQPNSPWVAGRLAEFIQNRLQNFHPQVTVVPARRRDGPNSTDDPDLNAPLLTANYIFMGPGSPTYAVRHLRGTWAWEVICARQRRGAVLALASAMAIAVSRYTLPVYEIYKVGADPHWTDGLDLLGPYGLELAIVTHWDNTEGGPHLDTRCGFMGVERMAHLMEILPPTATLVGIDEHTVLVLDFGAGVARVEGRGTVTVRRSGAAQVYPSGSDFPLNALGPVRIPDLEEGLSPPVVEAVLRAEEAAEAVPLEVLRMVAEREVARRERRWADADRLRERIRAHGFIVEDTREGPRLRRGPE
ncbi:MAG: cysteinyl-tRNA synthetase [Anaerolineae bacterium]|nr:cysteinyl-tRNA synthetase [Anaerolineae bacterium]MDW8069415.1 cysteinyl-tRNA synthetase [Anaerolineae bacterium]